MGAEGRNVRQGMGEKSEVSKIELLMNQVSITTDDRPVAAAAIKKAEETGAPAVAIQLDDGRIITGKTSSLLGSSSSMLLNALKVLGNIPDDINLISPTIIEPIQRMKTGFLGNHNPRLHTDEVLMALTISAINDPVAKSAIEQLEKLQGSDAHFSVILSDEDEKNLRRLGINVSCEPMYEHKRLYHK